MKRLHASVGPKLNPVVPGPRAKAIIAEDDVYMSPSYTRGYPLVVKRGYGCRIEDVDGNEFLDFTAGIAVNSTGHCHPEVVKAIQEQAATLLHMSGTDFYYDLMPKVAAKLSELAPMAGPHKIYFGNSGAEAVECAMKLARYHTGRQNIIAFYGSFHGRTMGALSLTGSKVQQKRRFAPFVPGVTHVRYPYAYRGCSGRTAGGGGVWVGVCAVYRGEAVQDDAWRRKRWRRSLWRRFKGEGGYIVPPDSFLQEIRKICDKHGILMVVDEIQSGAGRTGKWCAIEHSGVQPDIVTMAKGIASGMPLSACIAKAEVMNWVPGSHASTFGGNPLCLAAALATIEILQREGMANAATVGGAGLERLAGWVEKHEIVGEVRGRGLMIGVEIIENKRRRRLAGVLRDRIVDLAFEKGLLLLGCGENTIRLCPPLVVSQAEMDVALDLLEECVVEVSR